MFVWSISYCEHVGCLWLLFGCENVATAGENRGEN